jgi:TonB family protein
MRTFISFTIALVIHLAIYLLCFSTKTEKLSSFPANGQNKFSTVTLRNFSQSSKKSKHSSFSYDDISQHNEQINNQVLIQSAFKENTGSSNSENIIGEKKSNNSYEQPAYPAIARSRGIEGRVKIKVEFNNEGNVINMVIIESSNHQILDDAVKNTAIKWKNNSKEVISIEKTFEFKLTNK